MSRREERERRKEGLMRLDLWGVWGDGGRTKMSRDRPNMMLMKEPPPDSTARISCHGRGIRSQQGEKAATASGTKLSGKGEEILRGAFGDGLY